MLPWNRSLYDQNAAHVVSGGGGGGGSPTTWDPASNGGGITLSGGNLVATSSGAANPFIGTTTTRSSGKLYLEVAYSGGVAFGPTSWYGSIIDNAASFPTGYVFTQAGTWYVNGSNVGVDSQPSSGDTGCFAIDFTNQKIWFRTNNNNWNSSGTDDPATNTGGVSFAAAVSGGNFSFWINLGDGAGEIATLNVGTTAFGFTPPSGFSGWA